MLINTFINAQNIDIQKLHPFVNLEKGNFDDAISELSILISEKSEKEFLKARIEAYNNLNDYENAIKDCNTLEKFEYGISSEYIVNIYLQKNEIEMAEKKLIENLKSNYKISLFRLLTNPEYKKLQESQFIDSILKSNLYSSTEKQLYKIEKLISIENYADAYFMANELANRNPNIAQCFYFLSIISIHDNQLNNAKRYIDKAIDIKSNNIFYLQQRVLVNTILQAYNAAFIDIEKIIKLYPYLLNSYLQKAEILLNLKRTDEAIEQCTFYLTLFPESSEALFIKAKSYYLKGENLESLKCINESLSYKKSIKQFNLRGDIYMKTKTFHYAELDYSMALDLDAQNGELWAKKGLARYYAGNKQGACSDWVKGKRYGSLKAIEYFEKYCK